MNSNQAGHATPQQSSAFGSMSIFIAGLMILLGLIFPQNAAFGADITPPAIREMEPVVASTGAAPNRNIYVTFNEAMDPSTIVGANFTVMQGVTPVAGAVTYVGTTAIFNPTADLAPNLPYAATITTGVKDLAGNPLPSNFVWAFTTGSTNAVGPEPIVLGLTGKYAILAKTKVTTTGSTNITGDVGLNPAVESDLEGFGQTRDASNEWSTSTYVTGRLYTPDMAVPTPAAIVLAHDDMLRAFTDAAGRVPPDSTGLAGGGLNGQILAPGIYKWTSGLSITGGITLSGGPNDVWVFQIGTNLTVASGAVVTLSGGAQAKNVFWQVSGDVALGTTSQFKGTILCQTLIAVNTGAKLSGRALAQTAVTLVSNVVTADMTRPAVTSAVNANGATGVPVNPAPGIFFT